ncbi:hypothetical protein vseg_000526 [Gypsophila vaccaria]
MEKNNKFKLLKLPSFFTSSCKTQNLSHVIDHNKNPIISQTPLHEEIQHNVENKYPFINLTIKPKAKPIHNNYINNNNNNFSSFLQSPSSKLMMCKPRCPPASPLFPKQGSTDNNNNNKKKKTKKMKKKKNISKEKEKTTHSKNKNVFKSNPFSFSSSNETDDDDDGGGGDGDWFSSNDEREYNEKLTMFSLKSVSFSSKSILSFSSDSDSSQSQTQTRKPARPRPRRRKPSMRGKEAGAEPPEGKPRDPFSLKSVSFSSKSMSILSDDSDFPQTQTQTQKHANRPRPRRSRPRMRGKEVDSVPLEGKVEDTFAIVKSSSDPYNDFRTSMVEMIIEKQIFGAKELKQLLECFICLNSTHHHRVILEVFTEICDALFSHSS